MWLGALVFILAGCEGHIEHLDPGARPGREREADVHGGGVGSNGGGDAMAGNEPAGEDPAPAGASYDLSDPGRVSLRRLNRVEYNNTVRDLLGTELRPADEFPPDSISLGFDNIGDVQSLSPLQIELYLRAAGTLVDELMVDEERYVRFVPCDGNDDDCVRSAIAEFARRGFRRPVSTDEIDRLMQVVSGESPEDLPTREGIRAGLVSVLMSPHFLFRVELDPPSDLEKRELDPYELATRLSYLVYSSMPDEALFEAAEDGTLREDGVLGAQLDRMLADPRSDALVANFVGQWLHTRELADHDVNLTMFPEMDNALRRSMKEETRRFFAHLLETDAPLAELLSANYTFVNDRLAAHYDVPPGSAEDFRLVTWPEAVARRGLLGHASILTVTAMPSRTSIVRRGKFVLGDLLCDDPEPPPPDVEELAPPQEDEPLTLREQMERHRANPACAGCHKEMDPIGLGLEHFGPTGAHRLEDQWGAIDASSELPGAGSFDDAAGLAELLARDDRFARCVSEKMFIYATGRAVGEEDPWPRHLAGNVLARGGGLRTLLREIALSDAFRMQRSEP